MEKANELCGPGAIDSAGGSLRRVYPLVVLDWNGLGPVRRSTEGTGVGVIVMAKAVRPRVSDLHSPQVDTVGRVDVLAARLLKIVVDRSPDPYVKALYRQYQTTVDAAIHDTLGGFNCAKTLQQLGLVQPKPKPTPMPKPKRPKAKTGVKTKASHPGTGVVGVEFMDGPGRPVA
jgi:hypothetical protein